MRAKIVTTITTELDLETMEPTHAIAVEDCDGLSEIPDVIGSILLGAPRSAERSVRTQYPRVDQLADSADAEGGES